MGNPPDRERKSIVMRAPTPAAGAPRVQELTETAPERPQTVATGQRAETPAEGLPTALRAPGTPPTVPPPGETRDVWRDRLRVIGDRIIYGLVLLAVVKLRMADKLDLGTGSLLMLIAGIRAENVVAAIIAKNPASRAAMMLAGLGIDSETFRSWFRG